MKIKAEPKDYLPKFIFHPGDRFPQTQLKLQDDEWADLTKLKAQWLVLFFYPQDLSPTCSKQACNLQQAYAKLKKKHITIIGISPDDASKHQRFIAKYHLNFPLAIDQDAQLAKQLGVFSLKKFMGRVYDGIHRSSFILDHELIIRHIIYPVESGRHDEQILEAIKTLENR